MRQRKIPTFFLRDFHDVLPHRFNDLKQLVLFLFPDFHADQRIRQMLLHCIKLSAADLHSLMDRFHVPTLMFLWAASGSTQELDHPGLEPSDIRICRCPAYLRPAADEIHPWVTERARGPLIDDPFDSFLLPEPLIERFGRLLRLRDRALAAAVVEPASRQQQADRQKQTGSSHCFSIAPPRRPFTMPI